MNALIFETHVQSDRILHLPDNLPVGLRVRIVIEPVADPPHVEQAAFTATDFELPTMPSVYQGPSLTQQQMCDAIDWEAGQRR